MSKAKYALVYLIATLDFAQRSVHANKVSNDTDTIMEKCDNCGAEVEKCGTDSTGKKICCEHCAFHPLGCRCQYGEIGVAETMQYFDDDDYDDDDYDDDDDDYDEYENEEEDDEESEDSLIWRTCGIG